MPSRWRSSRRRGTISPHGCGRLTRTNVAAAVRALKKPSTVAWVANSLAREQPKQVDALLQAAEQLTRRPTAVARRPGERRGGRRGVGRRARGTAGDCSPRLEPHLERARPAPLLERLSQTLRAAAIDENGRTLLQRGRSDRGVEGCRLRTARGGDTVPPPRRRGRARGTRTGQGAEVRGTPSRYRGAPGRTGSERRRARSRDSRRRGSREAG